MKIEIKVPSMGESISTVVIGQVLKKDLSIVTVDSEILELETDKVNQVLYAPAAGQLTLLVKEQDKVAVGAIVGYIDDSFKGEKNPSIIEKKVEEKQDVSQPSQNALIIETKPNEKEIIRKNQDNFLHEINQGTLKLNQPLSNTKPDVKVDISNGARKETRQPLSKLRKVIAARLVEVQHTAAMLTTFNEVDMTNIMQMREKYKDIFIKKHASKLGFMSFFVKAVTAALKIYPVFNSYLNGNDIVHREYYDLGIAVGTEKGVIVPVVRNCDQLSFSGVELSIEDYAKKAKEGTLKADDLQGAGFTITNGGVYGSLLSTPILAPSQCGILGMHKIEKRAVVINDQIEIRPMMYLALSYDHRLADGKEAVSFLVHIKNLLEEPSRILLEV